MFKVRRYSCAGFIDFRLLPFASRLGPWHASDQRQQSFELGRHSYFHGVTERGDLIAHALQRIAEPSAVYHQPPSDGIPFCLISYQSYIHSFILVMCALRRLCHFVRLCAFSGLCRLRRGYRCLTATTHAQRALLRRRRRNLALCATPPPAGTSLAIAILIVNAY